ncbi:hypothetical protein L218DRAFT_1079004 [Marasmius fiardii PR-910]|nr:hypothetical protein L218DRAFT_1079004 [Marasmius fiardii PR-910]
MIAFRFMVVAAVLLQWQVMGLVIPSEEASVHLEARATNCPAGGKSPCACGGQIGLRASSLNCPNQKFTFDNPTDPKNGKMSKKAGTKGAGLQCDHLVELQFISQQMTADMCKHFLTAAGKKDMTRFRSFINKSPNLVLVDSKVNDAKGKCFNPAVKLSDGKSALGVVSYVGAIQSEATSVAGKIKAEMDSIAQAAKFTSFKSSFASDYSSTLNGVISTAKKNAARLSGPTAPATGKRPAGSTTPAPPAKKPKTATTAKAPPAKKPAAPPAKKPAAPPKAPAKKPAAPPKAPAKKPVAPKKTPAKKPVTAKKPKKGKKRSLNE